MIDIGWSEMAVVALIALLILGPKELPQAMRMVARWVKKLRAMTRDVQSGFDQMIREADLEETRKSIGNPNSSNWAERVGATIIDPTGTVDETLKDIESETKKTEREVNKQAASVAETAAATPESDAPAEPAAEPPVSENPAPASNPEPMPEPEKAPEPAKVLEGS